MIDLPGWANDALQGAIQPLSERREFLARELSQLRELYPSASTLDEEITRLQKADAVFVGRLMELLLEARDELRGSLPQAATLRWDDSGEHFVEPEAESAELPAFRRARVTSGGSQFLARLLRDLSDPIIYPIVFTHEASNNHRAVAVSALVVIARVVQEERGYDRRSVLHPGRLGFSREGELLRRIQAFADEDPGAHWLRWQRENPRPYQSAWSLRDQAGATLQLQADPVHCRLRIQRQDPSVRVRKRHTIFVDPLEAQREDRYYSGLAEMETALEEHLQGRIQAGFRLVHLQA